MKISISDQRWAIYCSGPNSKSYRGFTLKDGSKTKPNKAKLIFSNGEKDFEITEGSIEKAFIKSFDSIDTYLK